MIRIFMELVSAYLWILNPHVNGFTTSLNALLKDAWLADH